MLDFFQSGRHVGSADLRSEVVGGAEGGPPEPPEPPGEPPGRPPAAPGVGREPQGGPDLVLLVHAHQLAAAPGQLGFILHSNRADLQRELGLYFLDVGSLSLPEGAERWVQSHFNRLNELARGSPAAAEVAEALAGFGAD